MGRSQSWRTIIPEVIVEGIRAPDPGVLEGGVQKRRRPVSLCVCPRVSLSSPAVQSRPGREFRPGNETIDVSGAP